MHLYLSGNAQRRRALNCSSRTEQLPRRTAIYHQTNVRETSPSFLGCRTATMYIIYFLAKCSVKERAPCLMLVIYHDISMGMRGIRSMAMIRLASDCCNPFIWDPDPFQLRSGPPNTASQRCTAKTCRSSKLFAMRNDIKPHGKPWKLWCLHHLEHFFLAKIWTFTINWSCSWKYREPVACWQSRICPPEPRFCPCNQGNKLWNKVCSLVVGNMFTLLSSRKGWRGPEHWTCPGLRSWRRWLACKTMCSPWEFLHHGLRKEAQDSKDSIGTPWVSDWRLFQVLSLNLAPSPWGSHTWSE